jgi:predicted nucleic acid-binding protein
VGIVEAVGPGPVALDTAVFIYWMEENPRFLPAVQPVMEAIDAGSLPAVTSALTLLETLVVPYREGDRALAQAYERYLTRSRGLELVPLEVPVLRTAAELRATTGVKTPDALQLAAALHARCTAFLTQDRRLPDLPGLRVLQLSDFL